MIKLKLSEVELDARCIAWFCAVQASGVGSIIFFLAIGELIRPSPRFGWDATLWSAVFMIVVGQFIILPSAIASLPVGLAIRYGLEKTVGFGAVTCLCIGPIMGVIFEIGFNWVFPGDGLSNYCCRESTVFFAVGGLFGAFVWWYVEKKYLKVPI